MSCSKKTKNSFASVGCSSYRFLSVFCGDGVLFVFVPNRNLCIDGGYDICAEMYNKNILAPLATFIPKVRSFVNVFFFRACPDSVLRAIFSPAWG